jgi:hypothetical protein
MLSFHIVRRFFLFKRIGKIFLVPFDTIDYVLALPLSVPQRLFCMLIHFHILVRARIIWATPHGFIVIK